MGKGLVWEGLGWKCEVWGGGKWGGVLVMERVEEIWGSRGLAWVGVVREWRFRVGFMVDEGK